MIQTGLLVDGKYRVLGKIGQGGMSIIYLAINERANKMWAIKAVRKEGIQDHTSVQQSLMAEIHILKTLNHKYLPDIIDVIDDDDTFLIVMDYIQGKSLKEILKEKMETTGRPMDIEVVMALGKQLCDVLYYMHSRPNPVIYRDMKPSNVMLKPDGDISLIDFGTARFFKQGNSEDTVCLGTPGYAAPEQYGGSGQTRAGTDIYCLGATLHHLITGRDPGESPFNFPPITKCRPSLLHETPGILRNVLLGLEVIICKCTQYEIEDRYTSCAEVKYALEHPEELVRPYRRQLKQRLAAFGICSGLAAFFFIFGVYGIFMAGMTEKKGYDYWMSEGMFASGIQSIKFYEKAIELNPEKEEGYLAVLETMLEDNDFSDEDDRRLRTILNSRNAGRPQNNKVYLQNNKSGYVKFSYRLGLAYYYYADAVGDKSAAAGWFDHVALADMENLDFGKDEKYKKSWQARAQILGKISRYYKNQLGVINKMGDAQVSYLDYWNDLTALMAANIAGDDNVITELRLYGEIVYQIYTRTIEFKNEADLSSDALRDVLAEISDRISAMPIGGNKLARQLSEEIFVNIRLAEEHIEAVYHLPEEKDKVLTGT